MFIDAKRYCAALAVMACHLSCSAAQAVNYAFVYEASGIPFPTLVVFDLIDGGVSDSVLTVSAFDADGALSLYDSSGGFHATDVGFTLSDGDFFNEARFLLAPHHRFSFRFTVAGGSDAPEFIADQLTLFLTDAKSGFQLPLFPTTDPTGASSLMTLSWRATDPNELAVYAYTTPGLADWTVTQVPEVGVSRMLAAGLPMILITALRLRRCERQRIAARRERG